MAQTTVANEPVRCFEGKLQNRPESVQTGVAVDLMYFGKACSQALTGSNLGNIPHRTGLYTTGQSFFGIAAADVSVERLANPSTGIANSAPYGAYLVNTEFPVLRRGSIWVVSSDAVDNLSKSVFVRGSTTAGTAATITDTTTYAVADQDGLTSIITIVDGGVGSAAGAQTVTFSGATTTAASVAAQINGQIAGGHATVAGGQVVLTTDAAGSAVTIAAAAGTGALTWAAGVGGTGTPTAMPANSKGSFRATTATGYVDLGAIAPVAWAANATIGGVNYGLIDINMV